VFFYLSTTFLLALSVILNEYNKHTKTLDLKTFLRLNIIMQKSVKKCLRGSQEQIKRLHLLSFVKYKSSKNDIHAGYIAHLYERRGYLKIIMFAN